MMLRFLSCLLIVAIALPSLIAQNVSYVYNGTTTCFYSITQRSVTSNPLAIVGLSGWLTLDLNAGVLRVPNAPVTSGLFDGTPKQAYPISAINGTRTSAVAQTRQTNVSSIVGLSVPGYIYLTVADASESNIGYLTDPSFQWVLDYTGISLESNTTTTPPFTVALVALQPNMQYSALDLLATGLYTNGTFQLSSCSTNTFTVTVINNTPTPPPPSAVGDPAFTGFRGQKYQIHGMADTVYSIISDANIQLNSLFVFLTQGKCPIVAGKPLTNCWSHPGSYFGSLTLQTVNGDKLFLQSGSADIGFLSINFNGRNVSATNEILVGNAGTTKQMEVIMKSSHQITVKTPLYSFIMENSDSFINILSVEISSWQTLTHSIQSHGLLGQTWRVKKGVIEGSVDDYVEGNNDLFGNEFMYNKFTPITK